MSDAPLADCPKCGKATLSKKVSAAGFQLKGSGWYVTDFRDNKKSKTDQKAATESSAESKKDAGDSGTGDSKDAKTKEAPKAASGSGKESGGSGR
jgi:predicted nucleic acid-binding Zn ribbon protein